MDIKYVMRSMLVVILLVSVESRNESPRWLKRSIKKEKIRHRHGSGFVGRQSSQSFENPQAYKADCCKNGGRCIMGTFCQCTDNYFGRYCQYKTENRQCGKYKHGAWLKSGCNLCRCFDAVLSCIPRAYSGCDHKPVNIRDKYDPNDKVYIFPSEDDDSVNNETADDYEYEDRSSAANLIKLSSVCLTVILIVLSS